MTPQQSARLRADVDLYAATDGHVLRVGDVRHQVHLGQSDADHLLDALVHGGEPASPPARQALRALVDARLVDVPSPRHAVVGEGRLADALRAALARMGAAGHPSDPRIGAYDDDTDLPPTGTACWVAGNRVVLSPPAVSAPDVRARHEAATRHRVEDPRTAARPGGREVVPDPSPAGLELAAVHVAAELLRPERAPYDAVVVDLRMLTVTRHPVLPVPPAPR